MRAESGSRFRTPLGFYLIAIGSSCGLGNLWRFPFVTAENGGGTFVLFYLFFVFSIGLPLVIGELILGRQSRTCSIKAFGSLASLDTKKLRVPHWALRGVGFATFIVCLFVLSYYSVISGWVLHYFISLFLNLFRGGEELSDGSFLNLLSRGWLQVLLASVHLIFSGVIIFKGFFSGVERFLSYVVPLYLLTLVVLLVTSLNLNTSTDAIRFLFYPDFTKVTFSTLARAIGHVLFTLSVGFGTLVTYGAYLDDKKDIPASASKVTLLDTLISLGAGMLIFPILLLVGDIEGGDPTALFRAFPMFLGTLNGGTLIGVVFFFCLYLSSLAATVGLFQTVVDNISSHFKISTRVSVVSAGVLSLAVSVVPAFSQSIWGGRSLLFELDRILVHWMLPVVCLFVCLTLGWVLPKERAKSFFTEENLDRPDRIFRDWRLIISILAPGLIVIALALQVYAEFLK